MCKYNISNSVLASGNVEDLAFSSAIVEQSSSTPVVAECYKVLLGDWLSCAGHCNSSTAVTDPSCSAKVRTDEMKFYYDRGCENTQ